MKKDNKVLLIVVMFYILFILIQHAYLFVKVQQLADTGRITAKASGQINICANHPPVLDYSCPLTINQNEEYYCDINITDPDGGSFSVDIDFLPPPDLFLAPGGVINFTPNQSDVGNYTFRVSTWDDSGCLNNIISEDYNLTIVDVNDPPILIKLIPNQTWNQDTDLVAFDLDDYFFDPDGDPLNYSHTVLSNIIVTINNESVVTFRPVQGFYGTEYVTFIAEDPFNANATSNIVELQVIQTSSPSEPSGTTGSTGGGGGGGFSLDCIPQWYCRPWGPCEPDGFRHRECFDLNNCSTDFGRPNTTEACDFVSTCYDGFKGPEEEGVDCGGPCPECGTCYDNVCNNNEDCTRDLIDIPDCGGPCKSCDYPQNGTCYDNVCNNNEDCTFGYTDIPDCGGPCDECPQLQQPEEVRQFDWALLVLLILIALILGYLTKKAVPYLKFKLAKKRREKYEERLLLETKISESIYDSLLKLEKILDVEDIEKLIVLYSTIVRRYFKNLFDLDYEFTYEELIEEIESRKISESLKSVLKGFFDRSLEIEFSGKSVSREELKAMVSEFKQMVSSTSEAPYLDKEKTKQSTKKLDTVDKLFSKISEAETSLRNGKINEAYFIYTRVVHDFNSLNSKDKKKLHGFLSRLYEEIKLAREKYSYEHSTKQ